jgi:hypothetical protein
VPKKREPFDQRDLINALELHYGALSYPTHLMSTWPTHLPIFLRLPGKSAGGGWLSRSLIEADKGHKLLVVAPSHMETGNIQKLIATATGVLFLSRRLNSDNWSEGVLMAGLNIEIKPQLAEFGVIMEKRNEASPRGAKDQGGPEERLTQERA